MYKLARQVPSSSRRLVLITQRAEGPCQALLLQGGRRYASSDERPPQQHKPKSSHKLLWGFVGATVITGATIVYAKQSPEFREWILANYPWADKIIGIIYQEDSSIDNWALVQLGKAKESVGGLLFGKEGNIPEERPKPRELDAPQVWPPTDYGLPKPNLPQHYVAEKKIEEPKIIEPEPANVIKADPKPHTPSAPVHVSKDLVEMEQRVHDFTKIAIDHYNKAVEAYDVNDRILNKIVEASVEDLDQKKFDQLKAAQLERNNAVKTALDAAMKAESAMAELEKQLNTKGTAPPDAIASTKRHIANFRADLKAARDEFAAKEDKSCISDRYWQRVEAARLAYIDELQALLPGLDISARRLNFNCGDTDILLTHTLRQVLFLQRELAEAQTIREFKLKQALESKSDKELIEAKVEELLRKEKFNLEREYQKKSYTIKADLEKAQREQLKKQMDIYQDLLRDKLAAKEKEVLKRFEATISEKVEKERLMFHQQIAEMRGKLQAVEERLQARERSDAMSKRAQGLWAAGESLLAATRSPSGTAKVDNELKALEKAGGDDEFTKQVVKGVSTSAREKGVLTENALRENYIKMEKTALRVALVNKDGASLPVYVLSYLQSLLLFSRVGDIPKSELENQPTDYTDMDSYDILQRARYWIERNDIASALRYVNLLQGASRSAAASWRDAAVRYLEIRQAAEAVMAHAAASAQQHMHQ